MRIGKIILIAGAPRSGTTLLSNLLDSHPDFVVFPLEHCVFETYYNCQNKEIFRRDFVTERSYGQQAILGNANAFRTYQQKVQDVLNRDWQVQIASDVFRDEYASLMSTKQISLSNIFFALMSALCNSSDYYKQKSETAKFWVFKQPFYTELYYEKSKAELDAACLHIVRDVFSRYSSAKARRTRCADGRFKASKPINRQPANLAHCEISILSHWLAHSHAERYDDYHTVYFDHLRSPENFKYLADLLLKLGAHNFALRPTEAGQPVPPNSSFQENSRPLITSTAYEQLTNKAERAVNSLFLSRVAEQVPWLGLNKYPTSSALYHWCFPFKYERWRDYFVRIALSCKYLKQIRVYDCESRLLDILARMQTSPFRISGET